MNRGKRLLEGFVCSLIVALIGGCGSGGSSTGGGTTSQTASTVTLNGAGATFPYPLYSKWFDTYRTQTGVAINYQSIGSGAGIQQMRAGTVDFGASDAPLSDEKLAEMPKPVVHVPMVGGAVVLAYNLPQTPALQLAPEVLAGIFLGSITQWNDPKIAKANPGVTLPNLPILAVHRSDGSGTTNIFTTYLSTISPDWKTRAGANTSVSWPSGVGAKGNDGVAGMIQQTSGAIGYVELAYARQNHLAMASLRNRSGHFVAPSLASTSAAIAASAEALGRDVRTPIVDAPGDSSYPISALTFLLVYKEQPDAARAKALADFIRWAIHEGQDAAEPLDYARLPEAVVRVNESTLQTLTSGGKPIAGSQGGRPQRRVTRLPAVGRRT